MTIYDLGDKKPNLPPVGRYWIAPDAKIIGDVCLKEDVGIWFNAILRGDNEQICIGTGTNIQEAVIIHCDAGFPVHIGEYCTIGHRAIMHGCQIGNQTLIGMGATILNGAKIGNNCLVGANALVTEGKVFPDKSLIVGSPAKAVRPLTAEQMDALRHSADHYVNNWKFFSQALKEH